MVGNACVILVAPQTCRRQLRSRRDYSVRVYDRADRNEIRERPVGSKQLLIRSSSKCSFGGNRGDNRNITKRTLR
jgi:hypothetical protein